MRGDRIAPVVAGALVALAAPAAAAPCTVEMVRVPDDVRAVIEHWVGAESRCVVTLSVRVFPTDGGLYVFASDSSGRVRERLVPDATTAAVLIASWVADDGRPLATAPVTPAWAQSNPPVTPVWAQKHPPVTPHWAEPGAAERPPGSTEPVDVAAAATVQDSLQRLVTMGLTVHEDGAGVRGEIDLVRIWRMKLAVMAAWSHGETGEGPGSRALDDVVVTAQLANERRGARANLRGSIGAGLGFATSTPMSFDDEQHTTITPVVDAAISGGIRISNRFELRGGVSVTLVPERMDTDEWDGGIVPQLYLGVGYRGD